MSELNSPLVSYVKEQLKHDFNYLVKISPNADEAFILGNINELVAEVSVLGERTSDHILYKKSTGGIIMEVMAMPSKATVMFYNQVRPWIISGEMKDGVMNYTFADDTPNKVLELFSEIKDKLSYPSAAL
ncbi:TPA: hypothetical protein ACGOV2_001855 [Streptococcus suis]